MASVLRPISGISRNRRLASIVTTILCILCCIPQNGICFSGNDCNSNHLVDKILSQDEDSNAEALSKDFDEFHKIISLSDDPLAEGRKFLDAFIAEVNLRFCSAFSWSSLAWGINGRRWNSKGN
jgi:hypothetical protein